MKNEDLTTRLRKGTNTVEIASSGTPQTTTAQLTSTYYRPWQDLAPAAPNSDDVRSRTGGANELHLTVEFDKTQLKIGDDVTCTVEAARTGRSGAGMLIAEIGLPPGAEIDGESLDRAIQSSFWQVSRYEVQPDRVLIYLWPHSAGVRFQFKLRPRFAERAQTAPFVLYDYYNPDARVVLRPLRFRVGEPRVTR